MNLKHPNLTLSIISLSYLLLVIDLSIAVTALPLIQRDLGFTNTSLSWIQNAYTVVFGGLLLLGARIGDIFGRRKMFMLGLFIFGFASLVVGVSQSSEMLISGRVLQGVGAAVLAPSTLALLSTNFPDQPSRGRALAIYGSITGIGTSLGLVLGGWIAEAFDWRWAFLANVPLAIILIFATKFALAETATKRVSLDVLGALLSTAGMTGIVYGLIRAAELGWHDLIAWVCLFLGILLLVSFIGVEKRVAVPLVPLRLFKSAQRSGANLARALFVGSMAAYWFFVSQFLQVAKGMNPLETGFAFLPMTLASFAIAFFVPRLSRRFGDTPFLAGGLAAVAIGTMWLSAFTVEGSYILEVAIPMVLVGLGQGASTIRLTSAGISGVSPEDSGVASGLVSTSVQLGSSLGLSILIALAATVPVNHTNFAETITNQAHAALLGGGVLCVLALVVALVFVNKAHHVL